MFLTHIYTFGLESYNQPSPSPTESPTRTQHVNHKYVIRPAKSCPLRLRPISTPKGAAKLAGLRPPASLAPANLAAPIPTHPHCRRSESRLISLFLDRKSLGLAPHLELRGEQFELRVANQWGRDCGNLSFALCLMAPALLC